jgi:hypothetical protein
MLDQKTARILLDGLNRLEPAKYQGRNAMPDVMRKVPEEELLNILPLSQYSALWSQRVQAPEDYVPDWWGPNSRALRKKFYEEAFLPGLVEQVHYAGHSDHPHEYVDINLSVLNRYVNMPVQAENKGRGA